MKSKLLIIAAVVAQSMIASVSFAQRPNLGSANNFVLFSSNGEVKNSGHSIITGNVGNNIGACSGFGNVNGSMHDTDDVTKQCKQDLLLAYDQLAGTIPAYFPTPVFGLDDTITAGVYAINSAASLSGNYTLNGEGDTTSIFIFQVQGAFSTDTNSKVKLINGAKACNVFWKIEGMVNMGPGTSFKGTIIANNGAIVMAMGDTLEGRALSTTGAVSIYGIVATIPLGYGMPILSGPEKPTLGASACFALFSGNGEVTNAGVSYIKGDVGTNIGLTTGFNNLYITGAVHNIPDVSTALCNSSLGLLYDELNTTPHEIELLYPVQFGNNLELTPHTYLLDGATVLTDTVFLNAQGNEDAVFVIKINGAFSTGVYSKVVLKNGTQAKNVFWKIDGATSINDYSVFNGTIVGNNGAINLNTGVELNGRAFTTTGSLLTAAVTVSIPEACSLTAIETEVVINESVEVYPNPFKSSTTFKFNNQSSLQATQLSIYNMLGTEVRKVTLNNDVTTVETANMLPGVYLYKLTRNNALIQSGRLVAE